MKKVLLGMIVILVCATGTAYSEEIKTVVGKAVQGTFSVTLNDKLLPVDAIVIDGVSYIPVRAAADALGLKIDFDEKEGITLSQSVYMGGVIPGDPSIPERKGKLEQDIFYVKWEISSLKSGLEANKLYYSGGTTEHSGPAYETYLKMKLEYPSKIAELESQLADLEQQLAELQQP